MSNSRITCPECKSVLRPAKPVPDGAKVKCPKCGKSFAAQGLVDVIEVVEEEEAPRQKKPAKKIPGKSAKASIKKKSNAQPSAKKADHDDEDDDGGGIYSFVGANEQKKEEEEEEDDKPKIEYAPDMSIKDLRGPAQEAVVKPSNYIVLIGGVSALCNIFLICWSFWPMVFSETVVNWQNYLTKYYTDKQDKGAVQRIAAYKEFKDVKEEELKIIQEADDKAVTDFLVDGGFPFMGRLWLMGMFILVLIYNGIAVVGGVKMQNLESRRWSIASSIMMLFPMGCGGISFLVALALMFADQMIGILGELATPYAVGVGVIPYLGALYIGVISLQTLFSQKVIDGFEYVAE